MTPVSPLESALTKTARCHPRPQRLLQHLVATSANLHLYFQSLPRCSSRNPFPFMLLHCCRGVVGLLTRGSKCSFRRSNVFFNYPLCFQTFAHSFAPRAPCNPFGINSLRTLSHATEGGGYSFHSGTYFSYAGGSTRQEGRPSSPTLPFQPSTFDSQLTYD